MPDELSDATPHRRTDGPDMTTLRFLFRSRLPGRSYRALVMVDGQAVLVATVSNAVRYVK